MQTICPTSNSIWVNVQKMTVLMHKLLSPSWKWMHYWSRNVRYHQEL